jgi:histidinol-phosphate/aromatic aminotransferase/cobyric acid decarboxylase-like protein
VDGQPPTGLAVAGWGTPSGARLDLRYAPDEAEWLDPSPLAVWQAVVAAAPGLAEHYAVDDPYGGERGTGPIGRCFGIDLAPEQVTFGAGVTSLLHGLATLAGTGTVLVPALSHPDLGAWTRARGARVQTVPAPLCACALAEAIAAAAPALVQLDRPSAGGEVLALGEVTALAGAAAAAGGLLVVDEAPAPYLGPRASAVRLVERTAGLVVVRGFTKAYSLGGMRAGYAVASPDMAERVRTVLAPLQTSEPALAVALALLDAGDVCARLRERIHAIKPAIVARLRAAGLYVHAGHPDVPAVVVANRDGAAGRALARAGIAALAAGPLLHVRIPISDKRIAELDAAFGERAAR